MSGTVSKWDLINTSGDYVDLNTDLAWYPCTKGTTEAEAIVAQLTFIMWDGHPTSASLIILKNVSSGDHTELISSEISLEAAMKLVGSDNPFVQRMQWVLKKIA